MPKATNSTLPPVPKKKTVETVRIPKKELDALHEEIRSLKEQKKKWKLEKYKGKVNKLSPEAKAKRNKKNNEKRKAKVSEALLLMKTL